MTRAKHPLTLTVGQHRWHALLTPPQQEAAAEAWLKRQDIYAFHPVTHRTVMRRGKRITLTARYLPGYLFARFPGIPNVDALRRRGLIRDILRLHDGRIGILDPSDLEALHQMRNRDDEAREKARRAAALRAGDRVRILGGPFDGIDSEVIELRAGVAIVRLTLFGATRDVQVDVQKIGKVA